MKPCDVCGCRLGYEGMPSLLGSKRYAFCGECVKTVAEPYPALVASLASATDVDGESLRLKPIIDATLRLTGRSREKLEADVRAERELSPGGPRT